MVPFLFIAGLKKNGNLRWEIEKKATIILKVQNMDHSGDL